MAALPAFSFEEAKETEARYLDFKTRRRFKEKYLLPLTAYWRRLEPLRPEGRYLKEYRIKEMRKEINDLPAYIPFERTFADETRRDERMLQARDAFYSRPGRLRELEDRLLAEEEAALEQSPSPLSLNPRQSLQEYLARRILYRWLLKEETNLDELVKYQDVRDSLFDQGQEETPAEFEERRIRDKMRLYRFEPLRNFQIRLFRELMDTRTRDLIRQWRMRSDVFSNVRH